MEEHTIKTTIEALEPSYAHYGVTVATNRRKTRRTRLTIAYQAEGEWIRYGVAFLSFQDVKHFNPRRGEGLATQKMIHHPTMIRRLADDDLTSVRDHLQIALNTEGARHMVWGAPDNWRYANMYHTPLKV